MASRDESNRHYERLEEPLTSFPMIAKLGVYSDVVYNKPPSVIAHAPYREYFEDVDVRNSYQKYALMVKLDSKLYTSILRVAEAIRMAFKGLVVELGESVDPGEEQLASEIEEFQDDFDVPMLMQVLATRLLRDGDSVSHLVYETGLGITEIQHLPMEIVTALENESQLGQHDCQIWQKNFYAINESGREITRGNSDTGLHDEKTFPAREMLHLTLNPNQYLLKDNLGRWTFGVWSLSPLESLIGVVDWKFNTMMNDILYRNVAIPKWWVKVDTTPYNPRSYTDSTKAARIASAKTDAQAAMDDFADNWAHYEADQAIITDVGTEITIVEPKSTNYASPNELVNQLDGNITGNAGIPASVVGGKGESQSSAQAAGEYLTIHAEALLDTIAKGIIQLFKIHLATKYPAYNSQEAVPLTDRFGHYVCKKYSKKLLRKIKYKKTKIIMKDRAELMQLAATMKATKLYSWDEIRMETGYDPMTKEQKTTQYKELEKLGDVQKKDAGFRPQSPEATAAQIKKNPPTSPNEQLPSEREHDRLRRIHKDRNVSGVKKEE